MAEKKQEDRTFFSDYLKFKEGCIENKIFNIEEIIKLFEVWTRGGLGSICSSECNIK